MEIVNNIVFPEYVSYFSNAADEWNTQIVRTASGEELRLSYYSRALRKFTTNIDNLPDGTMAEVKDFYMNMRGRFYVFRFRDWTDYLWDHSKNAEPADISAYTGVGNYQLNKKYTTGSLTYAKDIKLPRVNGQIPPAGISYDLNHPSQDFELYIDTTLLTRGVDYTISTTTGIINIPSPLSGSVLKAKYEYDIACRFDTDSFDVTKNNSSTQTWSGFTIQEVRY